MADRRSSATKNAGQSPSTTQTSASKAAAAKAIQQENKGLTQKDLALKYGGRYQEGDTVYQVEAPRGRNLSITLNERLGFSDKTQTQKTQASTIQAQNYKRNVGEGGPGSPEQQALRKAEQGDPSSGISAKVYPTDQGSTQKGRNLSITLEEDLGFGEGQEKPRGAVSPYGGGLSGGISLLSGGIDGVTVKKGKLKQEPFTTNTFFDNIRKAFSEEGLESSKQTLIGYGEAAKNFGLNVIQENIRNFNPTIIKTVGVGNKAFDKTIGKAYIVDPELKKSYKGLEEEKIPGTFQEKLYSGKFSEIDLSDPKTRGNILFDVSTLAGPGGGTKAAIKGAEIGAISAEKKAVKSLSDYLKSVGDTFGLEKIGGKTEIQTKVIKPGGGMEFTERRKVQVTTGKGDYISSGMTQDKSQPIRILEAGQFEKGSKGEKLFKNPVEEVTPTGERPPTYSPSKMNIRGFLSLTEQKLLGVGKQDKKQFIYSSLEPTKPNQREFYKEGILSGGIKETGKSLTAPLKDIVSGKGIRDYINSGSKSIRGVYSETTAIKGELTAEKVSQNAEFKKQFPNLFKELNLFEKGKGTPFPKFGPEKEKIGAGGPGKAKGFSKDQMQTLKETAITKILEKQARQEMDILFKGPRFVPGGFVSPYSLYDQKQKVTYEDGSRSLEKYPTQQKGISGGIEDFINAKVITPQKSTNEGILRFNDFITTKLTPGKQKQKQELKGILSFRDDFSYVLRQGKKQKQPESFKFVDDLGYKLIRPDPVPEVPPNPVPEVPPELVPRLKPPPPIAYFPPLSLSSYGFGGQEGTKTVYSAYGLSEDINIKVLPTYSRYGTTSAVFKAQIKEDKRIQKLFYGGTKTRKGKSKKAKSKRRSKKR